MQPQRGFTLVEVLVGLAIVGIALGASLRTLGMGAQSASGMHARSLALWAAENQLTELRLRRALPGVGTTQQPCPQGTLALVCVQEVRNSGNRNFRQVAVRVHLDDGPALAELYALVSSLP